jgi:serine/threonine protein kinase
MLKPNQSLPSRRKYKILELIAEGGFADLYLGLNEKTNRKVTIKILRNSEFDSLIQAENYLRREVAFIDIQSKFSPNCLQLAEDIIEKRNPNKPRFILVMNYINGVDFEDWYSELLENPPPNLYKYLVQNIFLELSKYVEYCHHHGILHRDLSSGNVLVSMKKGKPVPAVIDWGAGLNFDPAELYEIPLLLEDMGDAKEFQIFTDGYSPPEIDMGKGMNCQSDIYSFGTIMYYAFTLGKTRKKCTKNEHYILDPIKKNKDCPAPLAKIVIKCTQYEPRDRYLSFDTIREDLQAFLKDERKKKSQEKKNKN